MSTDVIAVTVKPRDVVGKKVKHLRKEGLVPAVIHDHGKPSMHVSVPFIEITKVWQKAGKHHPLEITFGDQKHLAIIRDVDFEPRKYQIRHVVFNAIKQDEKVEAEVPLVFEGDAPAERTGLIVLRQLDAVTVEALPRDLPDELKLDLSGLTEIGDKLSVSDIKLPEGVEMITELEHPIVTVDEPRAHVEAEAEAEEETEGEESAADIPSDHGGKAETNEEE